MTPASLSLLCPPFFSVLSFPSIRMLLARSHGSWRPVRPSVPSCLPRLYYLATAGLFPGRRPTDPRPPGLSIQTHGLMPRQLHIFSCCWQQHEKNVLPSAFLCRICNLTLWQSFLFWGSLSYQGPPHYYLGFPSGIGRGEE